MNQKQSLALLKKYAPSKEDYNKVLTHGKAVQKYAIELAKQLKEKGIKVDMEIIKNGSLLHDIGYFIVYKDKPNRIRHGIEGGKFLRKEKLPIYARIAERHIGVGLTKKQIIKQKLPLPKKDFMPKTIEEQIIAYADTLISFDKRKTAEWAYKIFTKRAGKDYADFFAHVHNELMEILK